MLEHKPHQEEVDRRGDAHHEEGGKPLRHVEPEEEVQQDDVEEVIDHMGAREADALAERRLAAEGEDAGQIEVAEPAQDITGCVGNGQSGLIRQVQQIPKQQVDGIVDGSGNDAHDGEAQELRFLVVLPEEFDEGSEGHD